MLEVGDGHTLYVEEVGNPIGLPVIVLHGGPGGGCSPAMRRFFDPSSTGPSCSTSAVAAARGPTPV